MGRVMSAHDDKGLAPHSSCMCGLREREREREGEGGTTRHDGGIRYNAAA